MRKDIRLYNTALIYAQSGDWGSTITHLYQAIALEADEAEYHSLLAVAYLGCRDARIPVTEINPSLNEESPDCKIYTKLAQQTFYHAFLLDPGDPLLNSYLPWLFGILSDNEPPPNDDRPNDDPPNPDRCPRSPSPVTPTMGAMADLINAEAISQVP